MAEVSGSGPTEAQIIGLLGQIKLSTAAKLESGAPPWQATESGRRQRSALPSDKLGDSFNSQFERLSL